MQPENTRTVTKSFFETTEMHLLSEWRGPTSKANRVNENESSFSWHECMRNDCCEQFF